MRKVLIAIDTSENSLKAVEYAAGIIGHSDVHVTLFHVFFKAPYGQIVRSGDLPHHDVSFDGSTGEFKRWLGTQLMAAERALEKGRRILADAGIQNENIEVKLSESKEGVARDILSELENGGHDTIVVGRRGASGIRRFLTGGTASKIINHARNCAVWVVE